ncbi:hypothetical protein AMATHDRAFT_78864 [Amanita thiersii Skay4041]|uniref:Cytochrome P450 n=1 Tax=Amanita thiersii Skay4041 TaxID=703135 RepID=A0A2A9NZX7_9AGAR|nr:hypothetical protein AMATHDRAFT_78864 [Amanita thiersii Skay4041]
MDTLIFILLGCLASLAYHFWRVRVPRGATLPPGPSRLPFIGMIIPHECAWIKYTEWARQYGDIVYLESFGRPLVVLNSFRAATELFDKRATIYSDRPRLVMVDELVGWTWDMAHMPYSERWKMHRRVFHQSFQPRAIPEYFPILRHSAASLVHNLAINPEEYVGHIRQFAGGVVLRVTYGYNAKSRHDDYLQLVKEAMEPLMQSVHAGSFYVDFIPALKYIPSWFPGAEFKRKAKGWALSALRLRESPFQSVKDSIANGRCMPCFVSKQLEKAQNEDNLVLEEVVKNCAGIAYVAGSDTGVSLLESWFLAMITFPEAQARAQKELDAVVGSDRLPDFSDRASLPYLDAMLLETLRWNPPAPLGMPHNTRQDDIYEGYFIPKGTTVIANHWAILQNEEIYPEPQRFLPERFLPQEGRKSLLDPIIGGVFGFGRRICPGRYLALSSAWLAKAHVLACFEVRCAIDEHGKEMLPRIKNISGLVIHPHPFKIHLVPRSKELLSLVQVMNEEAYSTPLFLLYVLGS